MYYKFGGECVPAQPGLKSDFCLILLVSPYRQCQSHLIGNVLNVIIQDETKLNDLIKVFQDCVCRHMDYSYRFYKSHLSFYYETIKIIGFHIFWFCLVPIPFFVVLCILYASPYDLLRDYQNRQVLVQDCVCRHMDYFNLIYAFSSCILLRSVFINKV